MRNKRLPVNLISDDISALESVGEDGEPHGEDLDSNIKSMEELNP